MTYTDLPINEVSPNPDQPRKFFDAERLRELADSIAANGLLEPVVVRPVDGKFIIIAGERRWRASGMAECTTISAKVIEMDEAAAYVLSVAENINRADMTVMEESDSFQKLVGYGHDVPKIAEMFGKSTTYVEARLSLADLCTEARDLVARGQVGPWLARHVAKLQTANQRTVINKWARGEFDNESVAAEFASALHATETEVGFFDLVEPTFAEREEHKKQNSSVRKALDDIQRATALLATFAGQSPEELATLLGPETAVRLRQLDRLAESTTKARTNMRKAKLHHEARTLTVRQEIA